jgi:hypothetical protein
VDSSHLAPILESLFAELTEGTRTGSSPYVLNSGDGGLLRSLAKLSAAEASRSVNEGATIAAHAQHLRFGLSLMNRWASEGGNPFADAKWDEAWKLSTVDAGQWDEIRNGLADEARRWRTALATPRNVSDPELSGMVGSIAHLAYHIGAIRQIARSARGPKEGTFT